MGDISQSVFCLARVASGGVTMLGTAFVIGDNLLATAAHVVGGTDDNLGLILPKQTSLQDYQDSTDTQVQHTPVEIHALDPIRDLCVLKLVDGSAQIAYQIGSTDDLLPGMPVYMYGFPHADQGRFVLTQDITYVGARVFVGEAPGVKSKHVVLNTLSRPGQSGAPVFRTDQPTLAAIVIGAYAPGGGGGVIIGGIDPQTLHQTTQAISAEYLLDMR